LTSLFLSNRLPLTGGKKKIGKLASGMSFEEIMKEYDLTRQDILNAIAYTSSLMRIYRDRPARYLGWPDSSARMLEMSA